MPDERIAGSARLSGEASILYHLNLQQRFIAIIKKIFCFAAVDTDDSKEQLATETQSHDLHLLSHYGSYRRSARESHSARSDIRTNRLFNVSLQRLRLGQFPLHVGGQPYFRERTAAGQNGF